MAECVGDLPGHEHRSYGRFSHSPLGIAPAARRPGPSAVRRSALGGAATPRHLPPPVMLPGRVIDLAQAYRDLGRPWTHEELAARYAAAKRRGEQLLSETTAIALQRPIALLATAIPSADTLSVAIHLVHALPDGAHAKLAGGLLDTAETNAADALRRCHRALELDGHAHGYTAEEWLPVIYDAAAPLLESSRPDQEPPSLVRQTQEAVHWLSSSIACLDEDSPDAPAALADTLARLLVVYVFAGTARARSE
jgi:hypothetical protein